MNRVSTLVRMRTTSLSRRAYSTKPTAPSQPVAQTTSQTSNGTTFRDSLLTPFRAYSRAQQNHPYRTQLISTTVIFFTGDLCAQILFTPEGEHYDPKKGARAALIGGLAAIPSYHWFMFLGKNFNYASKALSIGVKVVINQFVFAISLNTFFFSMHSLLAGNTVQETAMRVKDAVPVSWMNGWKYWPAVMTLNFAYVPMQFRSIAAGGAAVIWQTYLSWLNSKMAKKEAVIEAKAPAMEAVV